MDCQSLLARTGTRKVTICLFRLNSYIHKSENQKNEEAEIFEAVAEEYLNYPLLRYRNLFCEIRYLDGIENSDFVEI